MRSLLLIPTAMNDSLPIAQVFDLPPVVVVAHLNGLVSWFEAVPMLAGEWASLGEPPAAWVRVDFERVTVAIPSSHGRHPSQRPGDQTEAYRDGTADDLDWLAGLLHG